MSDEGGFWGSFSRAAAELGKAARGAAQAASGSEAGRAATLGVDRLKFSWGELLQGPLVPQPYDLIRTPNWVKWYLPCALVTSYGVLHQQPTQPATCTIAGLAALAHLTAGEGYFLRRWGLNAFRIVERGEAHRFLSAPLLHTNLPHLATSLTALLKEGLPLERQMGTPAFVAAAASLTLMSQGLYVLLLWGAERAGFPAWLVDSFFHDYPIGLTSLAAGLQVVGTYLREADQGATMDELYPFVYGRYSYTLWPSLLAASSFGANPLHQACGILAGLLHVYGARAAATAWAHTTGQPAPAALRVLGARRHRQLGWGDLAVHAAFGGALVACFLFWGKGASGQ